MPELMTCHACGRRERAELIDAKPTYPGATDWERYECIACYGEGWAPLNLAFIALSVCPDLKPHYDTYLKAHKAKRVRYVCDRCGGSELRWDAYASWSVEKQDMQLVATFDNVVCEDCAETGDGDCDPVEIEMTSQTV